MRYDKILAGVFAAAVMAAVAPVWAQRQPAAAATGSAALPVVPGVSPDVAAALQQLSATDFAAREDAMAKLHEATMRDLRQTIAIQQVLLQWQEALANQFNALTNTASSDLEAQAQVAGLLDYNDAVTRWAIDAMALPDDQRDAMIKWGGGEKIQPVIGRLYSRNVETRVLGVRELAALEVSPETSLMLSMLLNDPERAVSLAVMEALANRKPEPLLMDGLWNIATYSLQQQLHPRSVRQKVLVVAGKQVSMVDPQSMAGMVRSTSDSDTATDILVKYNDPYVAKKLGETFASLGQGSNPNNEANLARLFSPNYGGDVARNFSRLIDTYKSREAVLYFQRVLENGLVNSDSGETTINNNGVQERWRFSTRIDIAMMLVRLTGQNPDDYGVKRMVNYSNRWGVKGSTAEEDDVVKKVQDWWKTHGKEYTAPGATMPATGPAAQGTPMNGDVTELRLERRNIVK